MDKPLTIKNIIEKALESDQIFSELKKFSPNYFKYISDDLKSLIRFILTNQNNLSKKNYFQIIDFLFNSGFDFKKKLFYSAEVQLQYIVLLRSVTEKEIKILNKADSLSFVLYSIYREWNDDLKLSEVDEKRLYNLFYRSIDLKNYELNLYIPKKNFSKLLEISKTKELKSILYFYGYKNNLFKKKNFIYNEIKNRNISDEIISLFFNVFSINELKQSKPKDAKVKRKNDRLDIELDNKFILTKKHKNIYRVLKNFDQVEILFSDLEKLKNYGRSKLLKLKNKGKILLNLIDPTLNIKKDSYVSEIFYNLFQNKGIEINYEKLNQDFSYFKELFKTLDIEKYEIKNKKLFIDLIDYFLKRFNSDLDKTTYFHPSIIKYIKSIDFLIDLKIQRPEKIIDMSHFLIIENIEEKKLKKFFSLLNKTEKEYFLNEFLNSLPKLNKTIIDEITKLDKKIKYKRIDTNIYEIFLKIHKFDQISEKQKKFIKKLDLDEAVLRYINKKLDEFSYIETEHEVFLNLIRFKLLKPQTINDILLLFNFYGYNEKKLKNLYREFIKKYKDFDFENRIPKKYIEILKEDFKNTLKRSKKKLLI